ncbi:tetratricopeptide repeat protein [Flavilitoribacter nigricans]|uniref:Tetratricopeptide repeat protein n=1 Tax=Flavilitoribacter nigricans (strain ATCC 23147 / DSM 23189 / NBRC 102662 / NCIMB 1420 / SS-2) TaxID=1122177 RepID=A0A2D0NGY7_FLAN2|nr:hypothetical protein [Flavilitoribacter nigricans]PHN07678.1 hypothetical protein CRP01_06145 [Flavilitoribacter nigricans DSM 23189 = NBRC 102662]
MKKLILGMFAFVLFAASLQAQDAKEAKKALNAFNLDQSNKEKLTEAVNAIEGEPSGEDAADPSFYLLKGDIYSALANQIAVIKQTGLGTEDELPKVDMLAVKAFKAYTTALEKNEQAKKSKKYYVRDAMKGLSEVQGHLYNFGIYAYEAQNYGAAYTNFAAGLEAHEVLKQNGESSTLDDEAALMDQKYLAGLAALNNNMLNMAGPIFEELYKADYDKPAIYEALYSLNSKAEDADLDAAYQYLQAGREKYPEEVSLLFAEINHFLKIGKLNELIGKLKTAIEKEPENLTLYVTMGSVYDNLYQKEFKAGNLEKATEYFDEALEYYNQTLQRDPKDFDAQYSIGALYYNRAANMTSELNELSNDFSKEGMKKYEAKKAEIFEEFDKALPYFQKAESLDPNSLNTLIALKEIYARKDDLDTSNKFKERMEKVQSGGSNDSSYFNE